MSGGTSIFAACEMAFSEADIEHRRRDAYVSVGAGHLLRGRNARHSFGNEFTAVSARRINIAMAARGASASAASLGPIMPPDVAESCFHYR